jgi:DNA-binding Lrp family transcriptional regulator
MSPAPAPIDATDRRLILATQAGLPLTPQPYHRLAAQLGLTADEVVQRLERMMRNGIIRRVGGVPNHYRLGYTANGMSVWDVEDAKVGALGAQVGALDYVSHCYLRERRMPAWRYNLFAMVHGRDRTEVEGKVTRIAEVLGEAARAHDVLYSSRILKKTGLRLA